MLSFFGARDLTQIVVEAKVWQLDFTIRLRGIDERERLDRRLRIAREIAPGLVVTDMADRVTFSKDLIVAATNEAFRQMEADSAEAMSRLTGGLGGALGGGFPF